MQYNHLSLVEQLLEEVEDKNKAQVFPTAEDSSFVYCPKAKTVDVEEWIAIYKDIQESLNATHNEFDEDETTVEEDDLLTFISVEGERESAVSISEFCRCKFGNAPNGRPRNVSSFSDQRQGKRKARFVEGWRLAV